MVMKIKIRKFLEACKLLCKTLIIAIRVKLLDIRIFIEERKDKDEDKFNAKLTTLYVTQIYLCQQGKELCDKAISICNEFKEGES
jgi:hypothetical protein